MRLLIATGADCGAGEPADDPYMLLTEPIIERLAALVLPKNHRVLEIALAACCSVLAPAITPRTATGRKLAWGVYGMIAVDIVVSYKVIFFRE